MSSHATARLVIAAAVALAATPSSAQDDPATADDGGAVPPRLAGLDQAGVRRELGDPTLARAEGFGAFWTYRLPRCALFVYFADDGRGLRVTGFSSGPRRYGDPAPSTNACLAQALAPPSGPAPKAESLDPR